MVVEKREGLSQEPNALSGSNSSGAQMWTVAQVSVEGDSQDYTPLHSQLLRGWK